MSSSYWKVDHELARAAGQLYQEEGLHPQDIASRTGCSVSTVYAALHQEGIELNRRNYKSMEIEAISYTGLDPIWAAEFRGFFYGDGAALMSKMDRKGSALYRPKLMITLRQDSLPLLEDVQAHLGGSVDAMRGAVNSFGYQCNPTARWYTCSYSNILAITRDVLLPGARLPASKRAQIELLHKAVCARLDMPYMMGPEDKTLLEDYYIRLKMLKRY